MSPYTYPDEKKLRDKGIKAFYFSYFFKWDVFENYQFVKEKYGFLESNSRISGTFQNYDSMDDKIDPLYYYMQYIKFGFGRALRDSSRLIQNNHLKRKEAIKLVEKYDGEYPQENLNEVLDFLNCSLIEFNENIDKHRNKEIWKLNGNKFEINFSIS